MISFILSLFIAVLFIAAMLIYKKFFSSSAKVSKNDAFCKTLLNYNPIIISGTQGSGKTTLAMSFIAYYLSINPTAKFFHCGLDGAMLGESFTDYERWHELPDDSIIYIDECDKHGFSNARFTDVSKLPAHLRALTELRHKGHHLILSTVNVKDVHYHARNLCPGWAELSRAFGLKFAKAELRPGWKDVKKLTKEEAKKYKNESTSAKVYHDAEVQKLFKSSSIHTSAYQVNIPWRSILFYLILVIAIVLLIKYTFFSLSDPFKKQEQQKQQEGAQSASSTGGLLSLAPAKSSPSPMPPAPVTATITEPTPTSGPVKLFTDRERAQFAVPEFMTDLEFVTYNEGGGYRCGSAKIGKRSRCWCDWMTDGNMGKANVSADTCFAHVTTRLYPRMDNTTKVASAASTTN